MLWEFQLQPMPDWGKRFSDLEENTVRKESVFVCIKTCLYDEQQKIPMGVLVLGHLLCSWRLNWSSYKGFEFICVFKWLCRALTFRMLKLKGFVLNFIWVMQLLAVSHKAWHASGQESIGEVLRSGEWDVMVTGPLWQPKGHHWGSCSMILLNPVSLPWCVIYGAMTECRSKLEILLRGFVPATSCCDSGGVLHCAAEQQSSQLTYCMPK